MNKYHVYFESLLGILSYDTICANSVDDALDIFYKNRRCCEALKVEEIM